MWFGEVIRNGGCESVSITFGTREPAFRTSQIKKRRLLIKKRIKREKLYEKKTKEERIKHKAKQTTIKPR